MPHTAMKTGDWTYLAHGLAPFALAPIRAMAANFDRFLFGNPFHPFSYTQSGRMLSASAQMFERTTRAYRPRPFGLAARESVVHETPFCRILRFDPLSGDAVIGLPKMLVVAPLSGHYATLLRGTVEGLLPHYEVYVTDWRDIRDVPMHEGRFGLDEYIDHMIEAFRLLGPDLHVLAVCQPGVPVSAAIALMEEDGDPHVPASAVLMGSPIDTDAAPTIVNKLAHERGIGWFRRNCIAEVPFVYRGAGRQVYPGFMQLWGFMAMNYDRHVSAHLELFDHLVIGDEESAEKKRAFYDEYMTVMDLPADFYLETVEKIFIENALAKGTLDHRGRRVDLAKITRCALMTLEGEKDDITGIGQTSALLRLATGLDDGLKEGVVQEGVGHYGLFNGRRYREEIVPRMRDFTERAERRLEAAA